MSQFFSTHLRPAAEVSGSLSSSRPGANLHVGISRAQFFDFVKIDSFVIAIVIGKSDVGQPAFPGVIDPGLEEFLSVRLDPMALRMRMVIGERKRWSNGVLE